MSGGDAGDRFKWNRLAHRRLALELEPVERRVTAALAQQLLVPAGLDHGAILDHENAIGVHDRLQTMGDHQRGAALAQAAHGILDLALGFAVERCGRLVEQDDGRVLDQGARDRDPLALAAGRLQAMLADRSVVASRKAHDEIVGVRGLGGGEDRLLRRATKPSRSKSPLRGVKLQGAPRKNPLPIRSGADRPDYFSLRSWSASKWSIRPTLEPTNLYRMRPHRHGDRQSSGPSRSSARYALGPMAS